MEDIAVVLLNWNGIHHLNTFMPSVVQNSPKAKIFLVDNGSDDQSVEWVRSTFPEVNIIEFETNFGFAGGYKKALTQIKFRYCVLLNTDVEVSEKWLEPLYNYMEGHPETAACMPKILKFGRSDEFEYAGAAGGYMDRFGFPFCRGRILQNVEKDNGQYDAVAEVFWATGAALFVRMADYFKAGELDSLFFAHMEEIDLCWRLQRLGKKVVCIPESKVYHLGGGTLANEKPYKLFLNYRNSLYMLIKNLHRADLWRIPVRMVLDGISAVIYILKGQFPQFMAVLRSHLTIYSHLAILLKKRKEINLPFIRLKDMQQVYKRLVVFESMVRKKKKYSEL